MEFISKSPNAKAQAAFDEIRARWLAMLSVPRIRKPGSVPRAVTLLDWEGDGSPEPNIKKLWDAYVPWAAAWNAGNFDLEQVVAQQANVNMAQGWVDQINNRIRQSEDPVVRQCLTDGSCTYFYRLDGLAGDGSLARFDIEKASDYNEFLASLPDVAAMPAKARQLGLDTMKELGRSIGENAGKFGVPLAAGFWSSLTTFQKIAVVTVGATVAAGAAAFGLAQVRALIPPSVRR